MVGYVPDRGDVAWLDFDPQKGKEIKKTRPALVVSPKIYNAKTGLAIFMPVTSKVKGYPFEVQIREKSVEGVVLSDQVRSLDWRARNAKLIAKVPEYVMEEILGKLKTLLD